MNYHCKYCGHKASSVRNLTTNACFNSPNGRHALYEGGEQSQYVCKYCGHKASSIVNLTANACFNSPNKKHEPAIQGTIATAERANPVDRGGSTSKLPMGCRVFIFAVVFLWFGVSAMWDHFTKPHDIASPDINSPSQSSDEIMSSHKQELLNAEQTLEENIKAAKEMISRLQKEEMERTQLEEQAATIALRAIAQAYPRTPEIGQRSYQARQQIGEIEHQYQFKYGAIRDKYEAAFRQQRDELQSAYESEVAAIKSGTVTATSQPGTKRAVTALKSSPAIRPLLDSPQNVIPSEISYSVVGIAPGDTLNVRIGAGASYDIVARLPSGFSGLRIVGPPVMNDTTEWVQIAFDKHTGWVAKLYLKAQ